jgi:DNA repair exonuclease SbcCD ATPase subunit
MKFLHNQLRDFENRWENGLVFVEGDDVEGAPNAEDTEEEEKKTKLEESRLQRVLKGRFLHLSVNDLDKVAKDVEKLDDNSKSKKIFEKKFRELTEYYITLVTTDPDKLPPRILSRIYQTPKLRSFLTAKMKETLQKLAGSHLRTLEEIVSRKTSTWTGEEGVRVCTLYQSLKKEKSKSTVQAKLFEETKEKLKQKRKQVLDKFKVETVEGKVKSVVEKGTSGHPPTKEEKLFLLETAKLFPDKNEWPADEKEWNHWTEIKDTTLKNLLEDIILADKSQEKVTPGNYLLWEVLQEVDFSTTENKKILRSLKLKQSDVKKAIGRLSTRWNAVQFIAFIKAQNVLTPEHLKVLQEILDDADGFFETGGVRAYPAMSLKDHEKLVAAIKERVSLEEKRKRIEEQSCEDVREKESADPSLTKKQKTYKENDEKEKETKTGVQALLTEDRLTELLSQIETKAAAIQTKLDEAQTELAEDNLKKERKEKLENNIQQFEAELFVLKGEGEKKGIDSEITEFIEYIKREDKEEKYVEVSAEKLKWIFRKFDRVGRSVTQKISFIDEWQKAYEGFEIAKKDLEGSRKALLDETKITESTNSEIEALEKKEEQLRQKQAELMKETSVEESLNNIYRDPIGEGKEIQEEYYKKLEKRVKDHTLTAADLDVMWSESGKYKTGKFKKYEEFRKTFSDKIKTYLGDPLTLEGDNVESWIANLNEKLSDVELLKYFKEDLDVFKSADSFGEGLLDTSVLLQGAKMHFRKKIRKHIEDAIENLRGEAAREEFSKYWDGIAKKAESNKDMVERSAQQQAHINRQKEISRNAETEKGKIDDTLSDEDVKRLNTAAGERERKAIEKAHEVEVERYRRGELVDYPTGRKVIDANGDEVDEVEKIYIPGQDDLNQLAAKTQESTKEIEKTSIGIARELEALGEGFSKWDASTEEEREHLHFSEEGLQEKLKGLLGQWKGSRKQLREGIDTQKETCLQHGELPPQRDNFNTNFVEKYYKNVDTVFHRADRFFSELTAEVESEGGFARDKDYFSMISLELRSLYGLCDLKGGVLSRETDRQKKNFKAQAKVITRLKEEGLWEKEDLDENLESFKNKFRTLRGEYHEKFARYTRNVNSISRVIEGDIRGMKDKEFMERYKIDKEAAQKIVQGHQAQKENFDDLWNEMIGGGDKKDFFNQDNPDFESDWTAQYKEAVLNEDGELMNTALGRFKDIEAITSNVDNAEIGSEKLVDWLKNYNETKGREKGVFGRFRFHAEEFSLYDLYRTIKESLDAAEKHWKRNSDKHVANLGTTFWGDDNRWGREFARMAEESESARFKEFETQYHDQPGWVILKAMRKSKNPDMVRGCINLLSEKGFLRWDDPILWEVLNRLSRNTYFNIPGDNDLTPHEKLERVKLACETIWTPEVFRQWETGLEGNLKKAKEQYDGEFAKYENDSNARTDIMAGMLQRWSQGEVDDVDPARYEHFLFASFRDGKMNGQPDQRWYFLLMGVATRNPRTGQALISEDVLMRVNKEFLQRFPFVDFLADKESPKLNGRIVPEGTPGARGGGGERALWCEEDYKNWARMLGTGDGTFNPKSPPASGKTEAFFYQVINESLTCKQRVQRMGRFAQAPDHDDGVNYQFVWDQNRVMENLNLESTGRGQFSEDFWRSWLSGFDKFIRNKKAMITHGDMVWGGQDFWDKDRKRHLLEIGKSLKVALTVTQTLQGNKSTQRGPTTFDQDEWEKKSDYSINGEESRNNVNDLFRYMMQEEGTDEYEEILDAKLRDEFGKDEKQRQGHERWRDVNSKVTNLLDSDGGDTYFRNEDLIENALNTYCTSSASRCSVDCIL